ncbi:TetR/AcrR family transcriptional regulator [Amycolatopsis sp. VS8301801F10]|uniref:TetR/AcrR family transcriptional regulator n=1 Tax=Amycolatopsis sp. VS8301801F10 TaxID=2652442 RepID=UPI0038FC3621
MASPTTPKRPYAPRLPPAERREQLLDTALEIINTDGVAAVSVDAVARLAGVTRPVVYGQFTDSDHILRELLDREGRRALAQLAAVIPADLTTADPVETFTTVARGFFDAVLAEPARWRSILLPVDASPPPVRKHKERSEALVRARFADLTRHFLRGRPGAEDIDVDLLAHLLLNALEEAGRLLLRAPGQYPPERLTAMARFLAETLIHRYP